MTGSGETPKLKKLDDPFFLCGSHSSPLVRRPSTLPSTDGFQTQPGKQIIKCYLCVFPSSLQLVPPLRAVSLSRQVKSGTWAPPTEGPVSQAVLVGCPLISLQKKLKLCNFPLGKAHTWLQLLGREWIEYLQVTASCCPQGHSFFLGAVWVVPRRSRLIVRSQFTLAVMGVVVCLAGNPGAGATSQVLYCLFC